MCGVLNVSGFWLFQDCLHLKIQNLQGYAGFIYFHKYVRVLNIPELPICPGF